MTVVWILIAFSLGVLVARGARRWLEARRRDLEMGRWDDFYDVFNDRSN